jgi:hypothetical protein
MKGNPLITQMSGQEKEQVRKRGLPPLLKIATAGASPPS